MDVEVTRIRKIFSDLLDEENGNLFSALKRYGAVIAEVLYSEEKYNLYKNFYSYWNIDLEKKWKKYLAANDYGRTVRYGYIDVRDLPERAEVKKVINYFLQKLIENCYMEEWPKELFLKKYDLYMNWFKNGLF